MQSPWYSVCLRIGGLDEGALTEAFARERRGVTSRRLSALLRGLACNIDNEELDPTSSQIFLIAKGSVTRRALEVR